MNWQINILRLAFLLIAAGSLNLPGSILSAAEGDPYQYSVGILYNVELEQGFEEHRKELRNSIHQFEISSGIQSDFKPNNYGWLNDSPFWQFEVDRQNEIDFHTWDAILRNDVLQKKYSDDIPPMRDEGPFSRLRYEASDAVLVRFNFPENPDREIKADFDKRISSAFNSKHRKILIDPVWFFAGFHSDHTFTCMMQKRPSLDDTSNS